MLLVLILNLLVAHAETPLCAPTEPLSRVYPSSSPWDSPVTAQWSIADQTLTVRFDVTVPVQSEKLVFEPGKDYPFQYDVTEVFVTVGNPLSQSFTYYEFEITPNKQIYNVRIKINGKKKTIQENPVLHSQSDAAKTDSGWSTVLKIPLESLGGSGDPAQIRGNLFAILGKDQRFFWSLNLPPVATQKQVNFHQPKYFKPLFDCTAP